VQREGELAPIDGVYEYSDQVAHDRGQVPMRAGKRQALQYAWHGTSTLSLTRRERARPPAREQQIDDIQLAQVVQAAWRNFRSPEVCVELFLILVLDLEYLEPPFA